MKASWVILLVGCTYGVAAVAGPATRPVADFSTAEMIDRLQQVGNDEFGVQTNIIAVGKEGQGQMPRGLVKMQDALPAPGEAVRELGRRGLAALPELLAHLDDARKTRAGVQRMASMTFSGEFDWNRRAGIPRPEGVVRYRQRGPIQPKIVGAPDSSTYTLSVGDVCFEVVAGIVNRSYRVARYQPSGIIIVNSPVLCPALRDAVRKEWAGLTPEKHRESLTRDVTRPDRPGRDASAVLILRQAYPEAVAAAVRQRLELGNYEFVAIRAFVEQSVLPVAGADERKRLIDDFVAREGTPGRDGLLRQLWDERSRKVDEPGENRGASWPVRVAPTDVLEEMGIKFDDEYPPLVDSVDYRDTGRFVAALGEIGSVELDRVIAASLRKFSTWHGPDRGFGDYVAEACVTALAGRGYDAELSAYCNRRANEVTGADDRETFRKLIDIIGTASRAKKEPVG